MDGDDDLDLFLVSVKSSAVTVLANDGRGAFGAPIVSPLPEEQRGFVVQDLDGDQDADIALAEPFKVTVALNKGNGTFEPGFAAPVGSDPIVVATGDFDGDGLPDLATANEIGAGEARNISILLNLGKATFTAPRNYATGPDPKLLVPADVDGDGDLDIILAHGGQAGKLSLFKNDGAGAFPEVGFVDLAFASPPHFVAAGDLSGDGKVDLLVTHTLRKLEILSNDGRGSFGAPLLLEAGLELREAMIMDLNGDGLNDVVAGGRFTPGLWIFLTRNAIQQFALGTGYTKLPLSLSTGDLDGDRDLDLTVFDGEKVKVLKNETPVHSEDRNADGIPDECQERDFRRGDANQNGGIEIADAILILATLFQGEEPVNCWKAADLDDNGAVQLTDAVDLLTYLFLGGREPPEPFKSCGRDANEDSLTCLGFAACR